MARLVMPFAKWAVTPLLSGLISSDIINAWRNSSVNRDLGMSPHEAFFCRKPLFAYDRLGTVDVVSVTPNELANISAAIDVLVRTSAAVSTAMVTAQYDSERIAPPSFAIGDHVLVYFPDRESKTLTHYRGPFRIAAPVDGSHGNYYVVKDVVQQTEYEVHVERLKPFDMSRTSIAEQAARQLPSRDMGIVVAVDGHRMNESQGLYEFCIRFYSGYRAWQLYPYVAKLDVVKQYVSAHNLNTRKQTPAQQLHRLTGQLAATPSPRPAPVHRQPRAPPRARCGPLSRFLSLLVASCRFLSLLVASSRF